MTIEHSDKNEVHLLGAVDLGSNSFRVEIGRVDGDRIVTESYWKETVRLAGGIDENGAFTPEIQQKALNALARFREKLEGIPAKNIRAVGTQALRVAKNSIEFLPKAEAVLGHPIEIIAGREEARLVFSGCAHTLPPSSEKRLVVDIGGASTELIIGCGYMAKECESFHVGCVNTSLQFFPDGKITAKALKEAQLHAQAEFEEAAQEFSNRNWDAAYGSAGTIGAVAEIGHAAGLTNGVVTPALLKELKKELIEIGDIHKIRFPGLKEDRREVIAGGLAVLSAVFETFKIKEMRPAQGALRVGLLYDMLGRQEQRDTRDSTVTSLIKRSGIDKQQAARVAALADKFFTDLDADSHSHDDRKLLQWAAMLHETGRLISPSSYHRHSQYILMHSDLPGFSRLDQAVMGNLVLSQRGNLRKVSASLVNPSMVNMIMALRLAVIFAHARRTVHLPEITLKRVEENGQTVFILSIDSQWLARHPLTNYLLEQEEGVWAKENIRFVFRKS
ncbi:MAG: Ppx/GppA phosphatase family protein [Sutterellaceae bacterium]|nr:Ppx/GppA phosphatase family protein [Sutterellaceae bacterium]